MAYKIKWTAPAIEDYNIVVDYLLVHWNISIANAFIGILYEKLNTLSYEPFIGIETENTDGVRSILITKHNRLFYRIKLNTIEILSIFDTRQLPSKKPF
jgi:plasmid stabilization system protein ParE